MRSSLQFYCTALFSLSIFFLSLSLSSSFRDPLGEMQRELPSTVQCAAGNSSVSSSRISDDECTQVPHLSLFLQLNCLFSSIVVYSFSLFTFCLSLLSSLICNLIIFTHWWPMSAAAVADAAVALAICFLSFCVLFTFFIFQ